MLDWFRWVGEDQRYEEHCLKSGQYVALSNNQPIREHYLQSQS